MDTLLARSLGARHENKIAMKCPSWPDTPLHQYFGARRINQRNSDFAISSLGYVRLYECCCPCDSNNMPKQEPECQTSFVHIEERLRSDGPFILYRRPPQRRVGHGLSERARERRLLKYYKYFQGFQRKLQVSRQFQQAYQKPENKAKVKKIINCYKPKITSQEQSAPKQLDSKETKPTAPSTSTSRSENKSTVSEVCKQKAGTANTSKKKNTKVKSAIAQTSAKKKELADTDILLKKPTRGTLKTPNLATIQEVTGDCDVLKSEKTIKAAPSGLLRVSINPVLPKKNQLQETYASHVPPSSLFKEPVQLRSILKNRKETTLQNDLKNAGSLQAAPSLEARCEVTSLTHPETQSPFFPKPNIKKSRRTRKVSTNIGTSGDDISSAGELKMTECATLKKEVLPKARRFRPVFTRMSDSDSRQISLSAPEHFDNIDDIEEINDVPEIVIENPTAQGTIDEKVDSQEFVNIPVDTNKLRGLSFKPGKRLSKRRTKLHAGNKIKFNGWDLGSSLGHHALKKIPGDKELCTQMLERAANLRWGEGLEGLDAENTISCRPLSKSERQKPEEYLQEKSLTQIFEHLTKSLVIEHSDRPFDGLHALAHDLAVQHANLQCIHKDLNDMGKKPKPGACSRYNDTSINLTMNKLASKPRQRIASVLKEIHSHSVSDLAT